MGEHDPYGVERHGEEMIGKKTGRGCYAAGTMKMLALFQRARELTKGTNPERRDTGPFTHSPPRSKYLKQPVRSTCSSSPKEIQK